MVAIPADSVGKRIITGKITSKRNDGKQKESHFSIPYKVVEPSMAVSTKYLIGGIENPVDIMVAGVEKERLIVEIKNADYRTQDGLFFIKPHGKDDVLVSVKIKTPSGKIIFDAKKEFQIYQPKK